MVALVKHDLEFTLKQIKIAEADADGGDLADLVAGYNGNDGLTQAHLLPYGLRTVDGSYNNLLPGREQWGASGESFPDLTGANYTVEHTVTIPDLSTHDPGEARWPPGSPLGPS